ncbi:MAG TPA: tRNA (adenosine(37)-N6)-threonylcarbamoyltransferase complex ATPase subunit type 1 TsaE [Candidatus Deferrimicrobiaceae bacterium]|nr:tRNA (adenosine(37)-N6)-threonylcarbamoyltransferase complex ATPase subunit type 1 TsaE [Candidatus Deferrimicrobiaceae bacterium]
MTLELRSSSEADTLEIARSLGALLVPGDVVALSGELGAGKTVFCKGVGEALGIPPGRIVSPSFTIVTEHPGAVRFIHVDVYRLSSEREAADIGLEEVLYGDGICVVEWAEKIATMLPNYCIKVKFLFSDEGGRRLVFDAEDAPRMNRFAARCRRYLTGG